MPLSENFQIEDIPPKIPVVDASIPDQELNLIVCHTEAQFALRRLIIDVARRHWKELEKMTLNQLLGHTA